MSPRVWIYIALALLWLGLAVAIVMGFHEMIPGLGRADDWKRYLAAGICLLMMSFNLARLYMLRKQEARARANP